MTDKSLLRQSFSIAGGDFSRAGMVSTDVKSILKDIGIKPAVIRRIAIATYEAEMNVVMYAREGTLNLTISPEEVNIMVEDRGKGIENLELAMKEGYSTATDEMREMGFGAGMGLPNIKRNSDRFDISSRLGMGTTLNILVRNVNGRAP